MDNPNLYDIVESFGFFCYSGEDGDLYRKHKLGGWRISIYPCHLTIEKKGEKWRGHQYWDFVKDYGVSSLEENWPQKIDENELRKDLKFLIENGYIEKQN